MREQPTPRVAVADRDAHQTAFSRRSANASSTPMRPSSTSGIAASSSRVHHAALIGALVGLVAQLAADDLGAVDDADAVVVDLDVAAAVPHLRARAASRPRAARRCCRRARSPRASSRSAPASGCSPKSMPPPGSVHAARAFGDVAEPAQQQSRRVVEAHVVRRDALDARQLAHRVRFRRTARRASRGTRPCPPTRSGDAVASAWK